jgi:hypothetical protein
MVMATKGKNMKKVRYVMIDQGYGPEEHWVRAKVIRSMKCQNLFDQGESEQLLVEILGGERLWVESWSDNAQ